MPAGSEPPAPLATRLRPKTFDQLVGGTIVVNSVLPATSLVAGAPPQIYTLKFVTASQFA